MSLKQTDIDNALFGAPSTGTHTPPFLAVGKSSAAAVDDMAGPQVACTRASLKLGVESRLQTHQILVYIDMIKWAVYYSR
jgi:hypothetical protein